jgi:putative membrane protein
MNPGQSLAIVNASLNATSFVLLLCGYICIRTRRPDWHRRFMKAAFVTSALFLVTYVARWLTTGTLYFQGHGLIKGIYLAILFTHMPLAISVVPLSLRALYLALKGRFAAHKRVTRWLYPIWTYVSVTGVMVYFLLYHVGAAPTPAALRQPDHAQQAQVAGR